MHMSGNPNIIQHWLIRLQMLTFIYLSEKYFEGGGHLLNKKKTLTYQRQLIY